MAGAYDKLATFMNETEHTIVRKYRHLAARDLLYLQAELCYLDIDYNLIAQQNATEEDERKIYDKEWWYLAKSKERGFDGKQWEQQLKIREKLREYYSCISQYEHISSLTSPKELERHNLHTWIDSKSLGGHCGFIGRDLSGFGQPSVYDKSNMKDLAMLSAHHGEGDALTRFISGPGLTLFHSIWRHKKKPLPLGPECQMTAKNHSAMHYYQESRVQKTIYVLGTVLSPIVPLSSIVALYFVQEMGARLGLVCGFTMLFAIVLALATNARRIEVFAAASAFASVQVVFIGNSPCPKP